MSGHHFLTAFRQLASWRCPAAPSTTAQVRSLRLSSSSSSSSVYTPAYSRLSHRRLLHNRHKSYSTAATASSATTPGHDHDHNIDAGTQHKKERVLLLMSGGVDSSMCAHILHNQGYAVTGLYMHNWNHDEETQDEVEALSSPTSQNSTYLAESTTPTDQQSSGGNGYKPMPRTAPIRPKACTSDRDWADVQSVCAQIGIPARRLDFSRQYWNQVFQVMLQEYERGRTPNPDVSCNREIKFGELVEWCWKNGGLGKDRGGRVEAAGGEEEEGWDYLATGHYARVERDPQTGVARLLRAKDSNKDQTYYLSTLSERVLRHVLFPLAQYDKPTVKRMALSFASSSSTANQDDELTSLQNAALKKESMGICFVGQRKRFGDFLKEYLDPLPGPVRINGLGGEVIGKHKGLFQYTVGQASGITHKHNKWVVLRTDLPSNTLIVVDGTQNDRLFSPGLIAEDWHWIAGAPPKKLLRLFSSSSSSSTTNQDEQDEYPFTAQIRHRQVPQPCAIEPISESTAAATAAAGDQVSSTTTIGDISSARLFRVKFKDFQRAIAPGQILVLYDKDECLGGAVIKSSLVRPEYANEDSGTQPSSTTN
ncbi:MAG: tRNA methyl transferase-domain-containing protein [Linnemannia elongata]|nr:MAG: tRNA methyl transferase-domain-containing protein [Linnemannia elongata]